MKPFGENVSWLKVGRKNTISVCVAAINVIFTLTFLVQSVPHHIRSYFGVKAWR